MQISWIGVNYWNENKKCLNRELTTAKRRGIMIMAAITTTIIIIDEVSTKRKTKITPMLILAQAKKEASTKGIILKINASKIIVARHRH